MKEFSSIVQERIGSYVYMLVDPRDNKIFYVGEGQGNRVFNHEQKAIDSSKESDKLNQIRDIHNAGLEVEKYIVRHGLHNKKTMLGKDVAFEIESTLIDLLSYRQFKQIDSLSNIVAGHHTFDRGIKTVEEIEILYDCPKIEINPKDRLLLVSLNKTFDEASSNGNSIDMYEITRKAWAISEQRARKVNYVLGIYRGVVRSVIEVKKYKCVKNANERNRYYFEGNLLTDSPYLNRDVSDYPFGSGGAIRYIPIEYNKWK